MIAIYDNAGASRLMALRLMALRLMALRHAFYALLLLVTAGCAGVAEKPLSERPVADSRISQDGGSGGMVKRVDDAVRKEYLNALSFLEQGNLVEAEQLLSGIVEKHPGLAAPLYNLGVLSERRNDQTQAERYYKKALEADASYYLALNNLGIIARSKGNFSASADYYLRGLRIAPDNEALHYNFGILNEIYLHEFEKAADHYERYLAIVEDTKQVGGDKDIESWIRNLRRRQQ